MNRFLSEIHKANNSMSRTIVIDLDGVITDFENCDVHCDYSGYPETASNLKRLQCPVRSRIPEFLRNLQESGIRIIIQTSRVEEEKYDTVCWLQENNIPYNEIYFNKPRGFIYIDDLGYQFTDILSCAEEIKRRQSI